MMRHKHKHGKSPPSAANTWGLSPDNALLQITTISSAGASRAAIGVPGF